MPVFKPRGKNLYLGFRWGKAEEEHTGSPSVPRPAVYSWIRLGGLPFNAVLWGSHLLTPHPSLLHPLPTTSLIHASVWESPKIHKLSLSETDACYVSSNGLLVSQHLGQLCMAFKRFIDAVRIPWFSRKKKCLYLWAWPDGRERLAFMKGTWRDAWLPRCASWACPLPPTAS